MRLEAGTRLVETVAGGRRGVEQGSWLASCSALKFRGSSRGEKGLRERHATGFVPHLLKSAARLGFLPAP